MGDGFQIIDIIVFAVIAALLILRLRSVLGRRTGAERRRDPFTPPAAETASEKVVPLPSRDHTAPSPVIEATSAPPGLTRIKAVERSFDQAAFLRGARAAFEIIVNAFAKGDTAALQPLLSEGVYASFAAAINARLAQHEVHQTNLLAIKAMEMVEAELEGDIAHITIKFVSDQINVTRAADGSVVEGDPDRVEEKTDLWTFSRSIRSRDPNWTLVATHSP